MAHCQNMKYQSEEIANKDYYQLLQNNKYLILHKKQITLTGENKVILSISMSKKI